MEEARRLAMDPEMMGNAEAADMGAVCGASLPSSSARITRACVLS